MHNIYKIFKKLQDIFKITRYLKNISKMSVMRLENEELKQILNI